MKHGNLDKLKCDTDTMAKAELIQPEKWLRGSEAIRINTALKDCLLYVESVNDINRAAAKHNRPDVFIEDVQEWFTGFGVGVILAAAMLF